MMIYCFSRDRRQSNSSSRGNKDGVKKGRQAQSNASSSRGKKEFRRKMKFDYFLAEKLMETATTTTVPQSSTKNVDGQSALNTTESIGTVSALSSF
jgi:hypothetical protein